jgi:hypothetical protein
VNLHYRHSTTYRSSCAPKGPAPVAVCMHMVACICKCIQWSPVEIRTPSHWNLISRSTTALPPELSPSSSLPPHPPHCTFIPAGKNWTRVSEMFFPQCHHMSLMDFVVSPSGCGRLVTDFWGWDAHEAQLRCPDEVDGDIWIWSNRRGLKPKFY